MTHFVVPDKSPNVTLVSPVGGATTFPFEFSYIAETDLAVSLDDVPQELTTDYTVVGNAKDEGFEGGSIVFNSLVPEGGVVVIIREIPVQRLTDFPIAGPFNITKLNTELDSIIMMMQETNTIVGNALHFPANDTNSPELAPVSQRADKYLAFNENGDLIYLDGTEAGPTTVQQSGNVTPDNLMSWAGPQLAKDSGIAAGSVYTTTNPPPDTSVNKIDKVPGPTAGNAVTQTGDGQLQDAGFGLIGLQVSEKKVSAWANNNHAAELHDLNTRPIMVHVDAEVKPGVTVGNWTENDRIPVSLGLTASLAGDEISAISLVLDTTTFRVRHTIRNDSGNGRFIAIPNKTGTTIHHVSASDVALVFTFFAIAG